MTCPDFPLWESNLGVKGGAGDGGGGSSFLDANYPPPQLTVGRVQVGQFGVVGGGGGWHKALVVGSVSLWWRLLASRP